MTSGSLKIFVSWVVAALNVFVLLDMIGSGIPLRATNLRRHRMNAWVVRLGVSSICMALVLPQMKRQFLQIAIQQSLLLCLQKGILPWIWIQVYPMIARPRVTFLHLFYTLRSCRSVFWWLAIPWWARNEISILLVFLLLHCASTCGDSLWFSLRVGSLVWVPKTCEARKSLGKVRKSECG